MALPELFGSYLLHHRLAQGSTSAVYLAQTTGDFPRLCALKRIRRELSALPEFDERFRHDANLLVRLAHGNLVQVLEVGTIEQEPFIAMEQIDGIDLRELVIDAPRSGPLPPELGLYVGLEMCEAVAYLQARRCEEGRTTTFSHEAAWPLEVMLSFDGLVKVIDLGSFGALRLGKQPIKHIFQSPGYAVPEVIVKKSLDLRSDLFAIGVILWECFSGQRLVAREPESYVRDVLAGTWEAPEIRRQDLAGEVIQVVAKMLAIDPDQRPDLDEARRGLVAALRHMAPAFGSGALSRLLWQRCESLVGNAEALTARVARQAPTLQTPPPIARTQTYGRSDFAEPHEVAPLELKIGDPIPGTRYRLVRMLGRGGSAEVFAAQHVDLERQVAIKILSPNMGDSSEAISQFRMEARACGRVAHPNIVDVIDFGELEDGRFFFAMELLDGQSLAELLADLLSEERTLEPARAIGIFRQITKALQAAHERGIIHRDLKPENVMLLHREGRDDFVKILDFGVMAFAGDTESARVGTPGYMAPEQVRGDAPTAAMDVYGLGSTLFEVLAGHTPFHHKPLETYIYQQARQPAPALRSSAPDAPIGLERLIQRALQRDPEARQPSMVAVEQELLLAQQEAGIVTDWDDLPRPGETRRPPSGQRPTTGNGRRTAWIAGGIGGAALLLLLTLVLVNSAPATKEQGAPPTPTTKAPASAPSRTPAAPASQIPAELLAKINAAIAKGHFTQPAGDSALDLLDRIKRSGSNKEQVARLQDRILKVLVGAADRLSDAGLKRSAMTLYREAVAFAPTSKRLVQLAYPDQRAPRSKRPPPDEARVAWLLSEIQHAVAEGRYIQPRNRSARYYLRQLEKIDPKGEYTRTVALKMSATMRQEAAEHWQRGDREQARRLYGVLAQLHPEDRLAQRRASATDAGVRPAKPTTNPKRSRTLVREGKQLLDKGKLSEARDRFLAALKANPRNARAMLSLAVVAFEAGRYAQTIDMSKRALSLNRRLVQAHLTLGDAYFKLYRFENARHAWQQVLAFEPNNRKAARRIEKIPTKK